MIPPCVKFLHVIRLCPRLCSTPQIPKFAPVARKYPTSYCMQKSTLRGLEGVTVEMRGWVDVPAGNWCAPSLIELLGHVGLSTSCGWH